MGRSCMTLTRMGGLCARTRRPAASSAWTPPRPASCSCRCASGWHGMPRATSRAVRWPSRSCRPCAPCGGRRGPRWGAGRRRATSGCGRWMGGRFELHIAAAPLRDGAGQIVGAVSVLHDVTERNRFGPRARGRACRRAGRPRNEPAHGGVPGHRRPRPALAAHRRHRLPRPRRAPLRSVGHRAARGPPPPSPPASRACTTTWRRRGRARRG